MKNKQEKQLPEKPTRKKQKYIGTQEFIDAQTGELRQFQVTDIEERDFNFYKIWMRNFIATLEMVGNQKTKVSYWIIDHIDRQNRLCCTFREISDETGVSYKTVSDTMQILQQENFLKKAHSGVYVVNPDIIYKGSSSGRLSILNNYHAIGDHPEPMTKEQQIEHLQRSIAKLQHQLARLTKDTQDAEVDDQFSFTEEGDIIQYAKSTNTN